MLMPPTLKCQSCNSPLGTMHMRNCPFELNLQQTAWQPPEPLDTKNTNPKDAIGVRKAPLSALPIRVLWRVGLAMLEGALKYGRHNYRAAGVRGSVYFDAVGRHLFSWWEGEDLDPDSNLSHIDKAIACLMVLRDSMLEGNWVDDRPPRTKNELASLNIAAGALIDHYQDKKPRHYTIADTP